MGERPRADRSSAAIRSAIQTWKPPAALTGLQILPDVAAFGVQSPALQGAFLDPAKTSVLVNALRASDPLRQATLPTAIGASLAVQVARPMVPIAGLPQFAAITEMSKGIAQIGERVAAITEALQGPAKTLQRMIESTSLSLKPWLPEFERFGEVMRQLAEEGRKIDEQTDIFVARHGWPVPVSLPARAYKAVVAKCQAGKREVNAMMVANFRPGKYVYSLMREVIDESPDFASRRPLLRQVYAAQRRKEWYLVINGLLPLVEGVLLDAMFPSGTRPKSIRPGVDRLKDAGEESYAEAGFRAIETMILGAGSGSALFEPYAPPAGVEPRSLNRHGVLHGSARRYGTEQNATKLFLLMVLLAECLARYKTVTDSELSRPRKSKTQT
jgi:hypothetical protein